MDWEFTFSLDCEGAEGSMIWKVSLSFIISWMFMAWELCLDLDSPSILSTSLLSIVRWSIFTFSWAVSLSICWILEVCREDSCRCLGRMLFFESYKLVKFSLLLLSDSSSLSSSFSWILNCSSSTMKLANWWSSSLRTSGMSPSFWEMFEGVSASFLVWSMAWSRLFLESMLLEYYS